MARSKKLAKLFASLSSLAEQFSKGKTQGVLKFQKVVLKQRDEMPDHPFDENFLRSQIEELNSCSLNNNQQNEDSAKIHSVPLKLNVK